MIYNSYLHIKHINMSLQIGHSHYWSAGLQTEVEGGEGGREKERERERERRHKCAG